ncbi:MAG: glycosyl transferase family 2, partial [Sulfurovum sp.]
ERRRGWQYAMNELELQKYFLKMGFIKKFEFLRNVSVRFGIRIVPKILLKFVYKMLRKDHLTN